MNNKNLILRIGEAIEQHRQAQAECRAASLSQPATHSLPKSWQRILPTFGNVLFTFLVIGGLLWAQNSGAMTLFAAPNAAAASTGTIAYQGRLANSAGAPLTQTVNMSFRLYSAASGGAPLWEEQWSGGNSVRVSDGLFNVMLGSVTPIPQAVITGNSNLFLGITVGTDSEMTPRVQLGSVPFATQALTVPDGSITTAKLADGAITAPKLGFTVLSTSKSCDVACGTPVEANLSGWQPVKGANSNDLMEVTVTTKGRPLSVSVTAGSEVSSTTWRWCRIRVLKGQTQVAIAYLDGSEIPTSDYSCSGTYVFANLPADTYTFRAEMAFGNAVNVTWHYSRQIAVFEY